ncbi:MAG: asparagine synthetase A [Nanobdellota archaeon]
MKESRLRIMGKVFRYTVDFFHERGFIQLMPVMLGKSVDPLGPDPSSSVVKIPEVDYQGDKLSLMTSMILHKQIALRRLEKIFIMSPNIRLESPGRKDSGKHLFEFTQADFEIRDAEMEEVFGLLEEYFAGLSKYLREHASQEFGKLGIPVFEFRTPFRKVLTEDLEKKYGKDWERIASEEATQPFWAISHKREFYEKEDPESEGRFLNYDLIYPKGFCEAISGGQREHDHDRLQEKIEKSGLDKKRYERYLSYAKQGLYPSAGAGIGMERLVRFLTQAEHAGDVSLFRRVPGESVEI